MTRHQSGKHQRRPGRGTVARTCPTPEEKAFARDLADALSHATVSVAADPEMVVADGSIAHYVRQRYSGFRREQHAAIQKRARSLLSGPIAERRRFLGSFAEIEPATWKDAERGLSAKLKTSLKEAVRARFR